MVFTTQLTTGGLVKANSVMKYLKVNQTTLEFKEIIYVDGTNGNDIIGDGSKSSPYATVIKGFDYLNENCREDGAILLADGEYDAGDLFTGYSSNLNNKYNNMKISLIPFTMGNVKLTNIGEWWLAQNAIDSKILIKIYGITLQNTGCMHLSGDSWRNEYYNCVFLKGYAGSNNFTSDAEVWVENSLFVGEPQETFIKQPLKGRAINCASTTIYISPYAGIKENVLYNIAHDSNYHITSSGWKNAGTGTNPDGSKAHIGVYGGQFAWGSTVEETKEIQPSTRTFKLVLEPDEQLQLSVDEDIAENTKMTWASSDSTITTVDSNGLIKTLKKGNSIITVKLEDNSYTEQIKVLVVDNAKEYRLTIDLKVGEKFRLTIDDAEDLVGSWTSLDSTVATITDKGRVTTVKTGLTIVTGYDEDGKEVGQVYVRVR